MRAEMLRGPRPLLEAAEVLRPPGRTAATSSRGASAGRSSCDRRSPMGRRSVNPGRSPAPASCHASSWTKRQSTPVPSAPTPARQGLRAHMAGLSGGSSGSHTLPVARSRGVRHSRDAPEIDVANAFAPTDTSVRGYMGGQNAARAAVAAAKAVPLWDLNVSQVRPHVSACHAPVPAAVDTEADASESIRDLPNELTAQLASRLLADLLEAYRNSTNLEDARASVGRSWGFADADEMTRCIEAQANASYHCTSMPQAA